MNTERKLQRQHLELPEDAAAWLVELRGRARSAPSPEARTEAWARFTGYIAALRAAGWSTASVNRVFGWSANGAYDAMRRNPPGPIPAGWVVPVPPARPPRERAAPRPRLTAEEVATLNDLRARSQMRGQVRGSTRENEPGWAAGREFAARVQHLLDNGHTAYGIAQDLGCQTMAIYNRLARHGYREFYPSQRPKRDPTITTGVVFSDRETA